MRLPGSSVPGLPRQYSCSEKSDYDGYVVEQFCNIRYQSIHLIATTRVTGLATALR
ncbi:hypothetical protein FHS27_006162 [Rhodopirellula rubra]|uniref:Uncharacterized protein n=1 Tax=Aporhodopirellula rubra TaxID=980271 RepID=A0A7W5E538_9BACT|nr:hypothetical protein [Aporhodopirellula rubra]